MSKKLLPLAIIALLLTVSAVVADDEVDSSKSQFVLIELFTSEGCSSCPPADDYINSVFIEARKNKEKVYLLAWHVDYWNKLKTRHGVWADPYSSTESTRRQRRYAKALSANRLATPQILIDAEPFQSYGKNSIKEILPGRIKEKRGASVSLTRTETGADWSVTGAVEGSELLIALVQRGIKQHVDKGENRGRDLEHENVVRWHTIIKLGKSNENGSLKVDLPEGVSADSAGIVAVVQTSANMKVQAATGLDW